MKEDISSDDRVDTNHEEDNHDVASAIRKIKASALLHQSANSKDESAITTEVANDSPVQSKLLPLSTQLSAHASSTVAEVGKILFAQADQSGDLRL